MFVKMLVYRLGGGSDLKRRIKVALANFYRHYQRSPATIVVHKSEAAEAVDIVKELAPRSKVPVRGNGGTLVGEVWLEIPKLKRPGSIHQQLSLLEVR